MDGSEFFFKKLAAELVTYGSFGHLSKISATNGVPAEVCEVSRIIEAY